MKWLTEQRDFCLFYHQKAPYRNWKPAPKYLNLYDDPKYADTREELHRKYGDSDELQQRYLDTYLERKSRRKKQ